MKRPSASVIGPSCSVCEDRVAAVRPPDMQPRGYIDRMELEEQQEMFGRLQSYPIPKPSQAPPPAVADNYSPTVYYDEEAASTAVADNYSPTATVLEDDKEDEQDDHDEEADYDHDEPSSSAGKRYRSRAPERATPTERQGKIKLMKQEPKDLPAPKRRNQRQLLLSTWTLGKEADPMEVRDKLLKSTHDCIVVMYSRSVCKSDPIAFWMTACKDTARFLKERAMFTLWDGCFIVTNRNKVIDVDMEMWDVSRLHVEDIRACGVHLATVKVSFNDERQMNVGVIGPIQPELSSQDEEDLVEWIIRSRVSVVTGYFGSRNSQQLRNVAIRTGAIYCQPAAQFVFGYGLLRAVTHPSFYMCFGNCRDFTMAQPTEIPPQWRFGEDLKQELIDVFDVPHWPENWDGNPMVHNLGLIKMKRLDFRKGRIAAPAHNVMQTCICLISLSTSKPAKRSMHEKEKKEAKLDAIVEKARAITRSQEEADAIMQEAIEEKEEEEMMADLIREIKEHEAKETKMELVKKER